MATSDDTDSSVVDLNADAAEKRERIEASRWTKTTHLHACDELIEDAIDMLSFLAPENHGEDATFLVSAVAAQANAIVEKLREAQKHFREGSV